MKKILMIAMVSLFIFGCGAAAKESGFWQHSTIYEDGDHLWFSWVGYKNITPKDVKESQADRWVGNTRGISHDEMI